MGGEDMARIGDSIHCQITFIVFSEGQGGQISSPGEPMAPIAPQHTVCLRVPWAKIVLACFLFSLASSGASETFQPDLR